MGLHHANAVVVIYDEAGQAVALAVNKAVAVGHAFAGDATGRTHRQGLCESAFHFEGSACNPIEKPTSDFFLFHLTRTTTWSRWFRNVLQLNLISFIITKILNFPQNYNASKYYANY